MSVWRPYGILKEAPEQHISRSLSPTHKRGEYHTCVGQHSSHYSLPIAHHTQHHATMHSHPTRQMYITAEWRNADGTPSRVRGVITVVLVIRVDSLGVEISLLRQNVCFTFQCVFLFNDGVQWWQRGFHYQMDYFGLKKYNSKCGWYLTSAVCVLDKKRSLTHILADAACRLLPSKIKSWVATDADTENNESTPTLTTAPRSLIQLDGDVATMQPVTKWNVIERPPKRIEEKGTQGASPAASPSPSTSSESSSSSTNPPLTTSQPSSPAPPPASSISWPSTTASNPFYNKLLVVLHGHPRSHPQLSVRLDTDIAAKRELLFQRDRYARKFFYLTGCFMLCLVFQRIPIWLAKNEIKALQKLEGGANNARSRSRLTRRTVV
eukprot:GHVN01057675.1.p1 GENE.GHVN01057675.1~~GHVN01057675.1.p1  ORF type:complete len:380 (-),score=43.64 GHVN01057675.1:857-1996(-)